MMEKGEKVTRMDMNDMQFVPKTWTKITEDVVDQLIRKWHFLEIWRKQANESVKREIQVMQAEIKQFDENIKIIDQ